MSGWLERLIFEHRRPMLWLLAVVSVLLTVQAGRLAIDAGFEKQLPLSHPYMETFVKHREQFGGANRLLISVRAKDGDLFDPAALERVREVTYALMEVPGVDRTSVKSIFTPNVRFVRIVEGGFEGGNVVPAEWQPTAEMAEQVRENVLYSGQVGRLVANDFSAAMVTATLVEQDPITKLKPDPIEVGNLLEEMVRLPHEDDVIAIHIIGFAKAISDIAGGAVLVVGFFVIALLVTAFLVRSFSGSWRLTLLPMACSLLAVIWTLGTITTLGYGLDPMSILVPFLIFAIGMSHGVQMTGAFSGAIVEGADASKAARIAFRQLLLPGCVALCSDSVGFLTLLFIEIGVIQHLAVMSAVGVVLIFATGFVLLPLLLGGMKVGDSFVERMAKPTPLRDSLWQRLAACTRGPVAVVLVLASITAVYWGWNRADEVIIGDANEGLPELHAESRYNVDTRNIAHSFSIGVDLITVIVETVPNASIDHDVMDRIDEFHWRISNIDGVRSAISLPMAARILAAAWSEGSPKWRELPRNSEILAQSLSSIETSTGLLNSDASVLPVLIFTEDHKAETINRVTSAVEKYGAELSSEKVHFRLATGNVGVMAATNQVVAAAQMEMLITIYLVVIALGLLAFRSIRATLCVILPLILVSILCYALMVIFDIGLKVSTLPVAALGVGIGVDYGIYITTQLMRSRRAGTDLESAYLVSLKRTGNAVLVTGLTLALGVATWIYSDLKLQADMGLLLCFMFAGNMIGALVLLPALQRVLPGGQGGGVKGAARESSASV